MALAPGQCASSSADELVGGRDPHLHHVAAGAHHGAQRPGLRRSRAQRQCSLCARSRRYSAITAASPASDLAPESTSPSRQVLIAFGLTGTTGCPASSSRSTRRPSGRSMADRQIAGVTVAGQAADQRGDPVRGMPDHELGHDLARGVQHAHGMGLSGPVDPGEEQRIRQRKRHRNSSRWQRRPGEEDSYRAVTNRRSAARLPVAGPCPRRNRGRWCHAGPSRATSTDRHPGSRRVPTTSTYRYP